MQHHDRERRVDGGGFERNLLRVAAAELHVADAALARDGFGAREHLERQSDAGYLTGAGGEPEVEGAGAAADIRDDEPARHELFEGDRAEAVVEAGFADALPVAGDGLEIAARAGGAFFQAALEAAAVVFGAGQLGAARRGGAEEPSGGPS